MIRGNPSIPERVPILEFPTPRGLEDVILRERRDMRKPANSQFEYGEAHADTVKYPSHKLARVTPDPELGWAQWIYLKDRADQNLYNWETSNQPDWPVLRQTFVVLRESFDPLPSDFNTEYPAPADLLDAGVLAEYEVTSVEQSRSGDAELDSLFVIVNVTRERLVPLSGQEFDSETGELRTVTREKVPAGTAGEFDGVTGTVKEVSPINSQWSLRTVKQVTGLAGSGDNSTRSYPEIVQYAWPAVLSAAQPYTVVSIPLRAGGYEQIVIPNMLRHRYSGPCVSEMIETWTKDAPAAILDLGVPVPEPIEYKGKLYDFDVEPTLHQGFRLYETSGTNHPDYKYYYYEQWIRSTNYTDWPEYIITDQTTQPFMGGYLTRRRKIYNPHTRSLGETVLLSVLSVGATTAELQWATGVTGTAEIQQRPNPSSSWVTIASGLTGSAYAVTGLSPRTSYEFRVRVGSTPVSSNIASITTDYAIPVVTGGSASATQGTSYSPLFTISATGVGPETTYGASGLPTGLTVNSSTGVISGTPTSTTGGLINVTISATSPAGTGTATLALTYAATPFITTSTGTRTTTLAATGGNGVAFSYQLYADNSPASFAATGLPSGLSLNTSTGLISGTVSGLTSNTSYTVNVTASNAVGTSTTAVLTLTFVILPVVVDGATTTAREGTSFSYTPTVTNTASSFTASGLPSGLSINATTGLISGTPTGTSNSTSTVTITATNAAGSSAPATLYIVLTARPTITPGQTYSHANNAGSVSFPVVASNIPTGWSYVGTVSFTPDAGNTNPSPAGADYRGATGVTFNTSTGTFTGSSNGSTRPVGVWVIALTASNAAGTRSSVNVTITVT